MDIAEVILSTPKDWSARVGLFGSWGSGKTTVLRYIADIVRARGSIVISLNPSFDSSFSEVIASFGEILLAELTERNLYVEPKVKTLLRKAPGIASGKAGDVIGAVGDLVKGAKLATAGFGLLSDWLTPTGDQIKTIVEALPEQRLVVLIDDLDRTTPELLPKFLMSLRELLDLPRFTFVLAFDDAIVSKAIADQNVGWAEGQDFLAKILDFRFSLPPIDEEGKRQILVRSLKENAPFVPSDSYLDVQDLIPNNPRRLKALVRGFLGIKATIARHNADEFEWTDLWLIQLLQQESHELVSRLAVESNFQECLGVLYRLKDQSSKEGRASVEPDKFEILLEEQKLPALVAMRVRRIADALRSRASFRLQYEFQWFVRPPAITWREFDSLLASWKSRSSQVLCKLLTAHAVARSDKLQRVEQEFFNALQDRTHELQDRAWRTADQAGAEHAFEQMKGYRNAVREFLKIPGLLTAARFTAVYQKTQQWLMSDRGELASQARIAERALLVELARSLPDSEVLAVLEVLQPWNEGSSPFPIPNLPQRRALNNELGQILRPRAEHMLETFMGQAGSIRKLGEGKQYAVFKALLFVEAGNWSPTIRKSFFALLGDASREDVAYANVKEFAELLIRALNFHANEISSSSVSILLRDEELLRGLWSALCSRDPLLAGVVWLLAAKEKFISAGAESRCMPESAAWTEEVAYFNANHESLMRNF